MVGPRGSKKKRGRRGIDGRHSVTTRNGPYRTNDRVQDRSNEDDDIDMASTSLNLEKTLEKEASKLRSRYAAAHKAYYAQQLAEIDARITDAQRRLGLNDEGSAQDGLSESIDIPNPDIKNPIESKLNVCKERHRLNTERILAEYQWRCAEADRELEASMEEIRVLSAKATLPSNSLQFIAPMKKESPTSRALYTLDTDLTDDIQTDLDRIRSLV
jgi:hypothetical protein